jgi:hypothetical protein
VELPEWLPQQTWQDFVTHRQNVRKPIKSATNVKYLLRELDKLRKAGNDPGEVLARSIANGWQGLFPLETGAKNGISVAEQTRQNAAIALERMEEREQARAASAGGAERNATEAEWADAVESRGTGVHG